MSKLRVLVIDDSLTIRGVLEEVLGQGGRCEVVGSASSIEEAREMIGALHPDVITLDLHLPDGDGLSFLDERTAAHHAPAVVISSSTGDGGDAAREAIARGAAACFDKSRLIAERNGIVKAIQVAALTHLRRRVALIERDLKLTPTRA